MPSVALAAVLGLTALTSCSADERVGPEDAVNALATGLSTFDLTGVPFTAATAAQAPADLATAVAEIGELRPEVEVGAVEVTETDQATTATAPLAYHWDLDDNAED